MANIEDYNNRLIKLHKIRPQYNFKTRRKTPSKAISQGEGQGP